MPIYEFKLVGGEEVIEKYFRVVEAPNLGATILTDGKLYRRIISSGVQADVKEFAHVSHSLPKHCKGAPAYDQAGRPAFSSQRQVQEFAARNKMHWD
jgi:hypothetical protein